MRLVPFLLRGERFSSGIGDPNADTWSTRLQVAARTLGLELNVLKASTERDIDTAFATLIPLRVGGCRSPVIVFLALAKIAKASCIANRWKVFAILLASIGAILLRLATTFYCLQPD
jgi:hypothetical protein